MQNGQNVTVTWLKIYSGNPLTEVPVTKTVSDTYLVIR